MSDRKGRSNRQRFPYRKDQEGNPRCRVCGVSLTGRKTSFCGPRCLRDFFMNTDWQRVRKVIRERDGHRCMKCGKKIGRGQDWHIDHIIPISKGGAEWDMNNLELSCAPCNLSKGAKLE